MEFNQLDQDLNLFKEEVEFIQFIDKLVLENETKLTKPEYRKLCFELNRLVSPYMLQPNLLDKSLKVQVPRLTLKLVNLLENMFQSSLTEKDILNEVEANELELEHLFTLCKVIDTLIKVRGFNTLKQFFSYDPKLLLLVLKSYLCIFDTQDMQHPHQNRQPEYESQFVFLCWLGEFTKIPFDLGLFQLDSKTLERFSRFKDKSLVEVLVEVGRQNLSLSSKVKFAAGKLVAKILTRKEVLASQLHPYLVWSNSQLTTTSDIYMLEGISTSLIQILKLGNRTDLLPFISQFEQNLQLLVENPSIDKLNNLRKLKLKLAQRIATLTLKPRLAKWRYLRGSRNLSHHIKPTDSQNQPNNPTKPIQHLQEQEEEEEEEEEEEILPIIESSLQLQFQGLVDMDQSNRILASKSVARLCQRLPKYFVADINLYLIQQLQSEPTTTAEGTQPNLWVDTNLWHGTLLTLAQLASRGLILKENLDLILDLVLDGLGLDIKNNSTYKGSNVRDAACFVLWSFARAYPPQPFLPKVNRLSTALVFTSLFDREINVRRAASATFQEFVGRLSIFPDGIAVLNLTDYFRIGNINYGYKEASLKVAKFEAYRIELFHHLLQVKIYHPDSNLRSLACTNLGTLVKEVGISNSKVSQLNSAKLAHVWNGGLVAAGSLISNLILAQSECFNFKIGSEVLPTHQLVPDSKLTFSQITELLLEVDRFQWSSIHSKLLRQAFNQAWFPLLSLDWPLTSQQLSSLMEKLVSNLNFNDSAVREEAGKNIGRLSAYRNLDADLAEFLVKVEANDGRLLVNNLIPIKYAKLDTEVVVKVVTACIAKIKLQYPNFTDSLTLEQIVLAIQTIVSQLTAPIPDPLFYDLIETLLLCLQDYQISAQGDIGSHLRRAAIEALAELLCAGAKTFENKLDARQASEVIGNLLKFSIERIDSLAHLSLSLLKKVLDEGEVKVEEENVLLPFKVNLFEKRNDSIGYTIQCLGSPEWASYVWLGLVYNFGARSKFEIESISDSLTDLLFNFDLAAKIQVLQPLIDNIDTEDTKLQLPLAETFLILVEATVLENLNENPEFMTNMNRKLLGLIYKLRKSKDVSQLTTVTKLACYLLTETHPPLRKKFWMHVLSSLNHPYPSVRWNTASNLTFALQTLIHPTVSFPEERVEQLQGLLQETDWNLDRKELQEPIHTIYQLVGIETVPKLKST